MKTYYSAIALLCVVAVLVTTAEPQCQCDEGSKISLTFNTNATLSQGNCGLLTLNNCSLNTTCHANSTLTPIKWERLGSVCSHNNTAVLHTSDNNRTFSINLMCSDDGKARLEEQSPKVLALKIPNNCSSIPNATNTTTALTEKPHSTEEVTTTANDSDTTASWTAISSNVTSEIPHHSETTQFSNSSSDTTERVPSRSSTDEYISTTHGIAVSLRVCSGLMVLILAVSSVL